MVKYHINSKGTPAPCKAKKGNCPFGGDDVHYDNLKDARAAATEMLENSHSILPGINEIDVSETYKQMKEDILKGDFESVEKEMIHHKAEDLEGVYKIIQEIRNRRNIKDTITQLKDQKEFINSEYAGQFKEIEENLIYNSKEIRNSEKEQLDLTMDIDNLEERATENNSGTCPKCGEGKMVERNSKYGVFIGCNTFPKCKHTHKKLIVNSAYYKKLKQMEIDYKVMLQDKRTEAIEIQKNDPSAIQAKNNLDKISGELRIAQYIDKYKNPFDKNYPKRKIASTETPIETYYQRRRLADGLIESSIGENELVLSSGKMKIGINNELKTDLSVNKDGEINNLYLEDSVKLGEVKQIVKIDSSGTLKSKDGEEILFAHARNWKMENIRNRDVKKGTSNRWKLYSTKVKGDKYEGPQRIKYTTIDSGD